MQSNTGLGYVVAIPSEREDYTTHSNHTLQDSSGIEIGLDFSNEGQKE